VNSPTPAEANIAADSKGNKVLLARVYRAQSKNLLQSRC
jgi:hypothetical protein